MRYWQDLNKEAVNLFQIVEEDESQSNTDHVTSLMDHFIIPAMSFLNGKDASINGADKLSGSSSQDSLATVAIRNSWFSLLGDSECG